MRRNCICPKRYFLEYLLRDLCFLNLQGYFYIFHFILRQFNLNPTILNLSKSISILFFTQSSFVTPRACRRAMRRRRLSTLTCVDECHPISQSAVVVVMLTLFAEFCNLNLTQFAALRDEGSRGRITGFCFTSFLSSSFSFIVIFVI